MRVIPLVAVTDATLVSTNVPEDDYPVWVAGTTYAVDARVISLFTHGIYQNRVAGNVGKDPVNPANIFDPEKNPTGQWIYVSKTNRWRAFDGLNSAKVRRANAIEYVLQVTATMNIVALTGLEARSVRVEVLNGDGVGVFDETRQLLDTSSVRTWFDYFTFEPDQFVENQVFYGLNAFAGYQLRVTIENDGGIAAASIIGFGRRRVLGRLLFSTSPSNIDYSTNEVDAFGEQMLVQRGYARKIQFQLAFPKEDYARIERILLPLRAVPAIYYENEELYHNLIVLGTYADFSPSLEIGISTAALTVTGNI
ncbi:hypothetical protein SAMN05444339_11041 [Loktanella atrilutea]|uniref:Carbohydrate binding domain-containing protein n=1 Tax=Loktanella atrilutea TaxID=366533 RepID=A0A1M5DL77_LOKAT|nr:hypothetical protein [Loktanella atrilutea]SHF67654.1 hypothetical protein SAMN05444339_11041 [Loktanella atrilutea]